MIRTKDGTPEEIEAALCASMVSLHMTLPVVATALVGDVLDVMFTERSVLSWAEARGFNTHCKTCIVNDWAKHAGAKPAPREERKLKAAMRMFGSRDLSSN